MGVKVAYSRISCIVIYLFSMEFGSPPLYAEVNRVARQMDLTYLNELGPYIRVLSQVSDSGEEKKRHEDRM